MNNKTNSVFQLLAIVSIMLFSLSSKAQQLPLFNFFGSSGTDKTNNFVGGASSCFAISGSSAPIVFQSGIATFDACGR